MYAAVLLLSGTEGARAMLSDHLSDAADMTVHVGEMQVGWNLDLQLENISASIDEELEMPELTIGRLTLTWTWDDLWGDEPAPAVVFNDCQLRLLQTENGQWEPAKLAPLANKITKLGKLDALNKMMTLNENVHADKNSASEDAQAKESDGDIESADLFKNWNFTISDATIVWWNGEQDVATIEGLDFVTRMMQMPDREMRYFKVSADDVQLGLHQHMRDISFEILSTTNHNVILGLKMDRQQAQDPELATKREAKKAKRKADYEREQALVREAEAFVSNNRSTSQEPSFAKIEQVVKKPAYATPTPRPKPTEPTPRPVPMSAPVRVVRAVVTMDEDTISPEESLAMAEMMEVSEQMTEDGLAESNLENFSEDESEELIMYIQEMLESDDENY